MSTDKSTSTVVNGISRRIASSMAGKEIRTERVRITPAVAKKWLEQNTDSNRNISIRTVEAYATEMKAGRWVLTHQGIAFNQSGELIDGQHRLHAIVLADVSVDMIVSTGLQLEYNSPLDQGYNRSFAHVLGKSSRWVSVVRALLVLEGGLQDTSFKSTTGLLETCAARHSAAIDACLAIAKSPRANPSGHVAALAYAYPVEINKVASFAQEVESGELLTKGDPAFTLRKWIAKGRHSSRETILASIASIRAALTGKRLTSIYAGVNLNGTDIERDGTSNYIWLVQRRRGAKIFDGTPGVDLVAGVGKKAENEGAG